MSPRPAEPGRVRRAAAAVTALVLALTLAGCGFTPEPPEVTPTPGSTPRPFTIMSTDPVRQTDPAAMTDTGSPILAANVFQRLMTADPGAAAPKPDAARECVFTAETTLTCTLNEDLRFHNGHLLTASDVEFSVERAARLDVPGSSASLLSSLRSVETPDDLTVRFLLSRPDTQFIWALASPAASLVDEETYDPDAVQAPEEDIVGSGPFRVARFRGDQLLVNRFAEYVGRSPGSLEEVLFVTAPDSATIEDAMTRGTVEVVWRGLNAAAITRNTSQVAASPDRVTVSGYAQAVTPGTRVLQLAWNPESPERRSRPLRQAIAVALQGDRTLASLVPGGVTGHTPSFPLGGKANPKVTWENRITLTLGYDPRIPNGEDFATQIRTRLEDTGGLSVQLRPDDDGADLRLMDRKAWTATTLAWLQPYLDAPLPGAPRSTLRSVVGEFRRTYTVDEALRLQADLQKQAAVDQTMLPLSQSDEYVYYRQGLTFAPGSFGPGWQFGFFGIGRG